MHQRVAALIQRASRKIKAALNGVSKARHERLLLKLPADNKCDGIVVHIPAKRVQQIRKKRNNKSVRNCMKNKA
jgi:hypothetical protein